MDATELRPGDWIFRPVNVFVGGMIIVPALDKLAVDVTPLAADEHQEREGFVLCKAHGEGIVSLRKVHCRLVEKYWSSRWLGVYVPEQRWRKGLNLRPKGYDLLCLRVTKVLSPSSVAASPIFVKNPKKVLKRILETKKLRLKRQDGRVEEFDLS